MTIEEEIEAALANQQVQNNQDYLVNSIPGIQESLVAANSFPVDALNQTANNLFGSNFNSKRVEGLNLNTQQGNVGLLEDEIKAVQDREAAQRKADKEDLEFQLKLGKAKRDELKFQKDLEVKDSQIARNLRPSSSSSRSSSGGGSGSGVEPRTRKSFLGFFGDVARNTLGNNGTKSQIFKSFESDLQSLEKNNFKIEEANSRANQVLTALNNPNGVNPASIGGIATALAKAAGETGVLTDVDIGRFKGSQSVFAKINRYIKEKTKGTLPEQDIKELRELANLYIDTAKQKSGKSVRRLARRLKGRFGVSSKELIDNSFLDSVASPFSAEELGLAEPKPVAGDEEFIGPLPQATAESADDRRARLRAAIKARRAGN